MKIETPLALLHAQLSLAAKSLDYSVHSSKNGFDKEKSSGCRFAFVIRTQQRETLSSAARFDESGIASFGFNDSARARN